MAIMHIYPHIPTVVSKIKLTFRNRYYAVITVLMRNYCVITFCNMLIIFNVITLKRNIFIFNLR